MRWRNEHVRRILELARAEAALLGHQYLGPEHLLLGILRDDGGTAAGVLRAQGADLESARAALHRLAEQGVVPGPRPSDAELLGAIGIDLEAVRREIEHSFDEQAIQKAAKEATRARRRGVGRVPRTPLQGPPMLAAQALQLSRTQAKALGIDKLTPELLLLGVLEDIWTARPRCLSNPWTRRLHASVGLPEAYQGAAGPLLAALGVDPKRLHDAVSAELRDAVS
jgi:hypothetical protein